MNDQTDPAALKPCPFCGGASFTYRAAQVGDSYYCNDCGAYGPLADPDTIKERWNTRASDPAALVKAALKAAMKLANVVEYADRPAWANTGSWCHAVELYGMRIRALADDPETVSKIIEQAKGEKE